MPHAQRRKIDACTANLAQEKEANDDDTKTPPSSTKSSGDSDETGQNHNPKMKERFQERGGVKTPPKGLHIDGKHASSFRKLVIPQKRTCRGLESANVMKVSHPEYK